MNHIIKSDQELKLFFKEKKINVLKILHKYEQNKLGHSYACVSCSYTTVRCWLCDQCISCCTFNVNLLENANPT